MLKFEYSDRAKMGVSRGGQELWPDQFNLGKTVKFLGPVRLWVIMSGVLYFFYRQNLLSLIDRHSKAVKISWTENSSGSGL